jgi:hypothetical protein
VESVANRDPHPPGAIAEGWREYNATVVPDAEPAGVRFLLELAYYAGAAQALSELGADDERGWPSIVARLALEVCDATDRVVLDAMRGRLPR